MSIEFTNSLTTRIAAFIACVGIGIEKGETTDDAFLPGILVRGGALVIDEAKLLYPGDMLHEAGHLAMVPAAIRATINGEVAVPGANPAVVEVEAMLWSYAAALAIGIDPAEVFHPHGYYGRSAGLLANFDAGIYLGLPGLEAAGMAYSPAMAAALGLAPFPAMQKWLMD